MSLPLKALNAPPHLTSTPSPHRAVPLQGYKLKPQHGYLETEWGYHDNAAWLPRERIMVTTKSPINLIQWVINTPIRGGRQPKYGAAGIPSFGIFVYIP